MKNQKFLLNIQTKCGDIANEILNAAIDTERNKWRCKWNKCKWTLIPQKVLRRPHFVVAFLLERVKQSKVSWWVQGQQKPDFFISLDNEKWCVKKKLDQSLLWVKNLLWEHGNKLIKETYGASIFKRNQWIEINIPFFIFCFFR